MAYQVTETIHHGDYLNVRTTRANDAGELADWIEGSPYAVPRLAADKLAAEVIHWGKADWYGWHTYVLEN